MRKRRAAEFSLPRVIGAIASGAVFGLLLVTTTGLFSIQRYGSELGAVMDPWSNSIVAIVDPHRSVFSVAGVAVCGALALGSVLWHRPHTCLTTAHAWSLVASGTILSSTGAWLSSHLGLQHDLETREGISPGLRGWLEYGGNEPAVYLVLLSVVAITLSRQAEIRSGSREAT